jgi:hypothetical protein
LRAANALASRLRAAVTGVPIAPRIASQDAGAGAATARPIALSEDAERILAQAPVFGRNRD